MSNLIQIRNVPDDVHARLKARAKARGESLNSYMLELLEREARTLTKAEIVARISARGPLGKPGGPSAAKLIREAREERDAQLMAAISTTRDDSR
jgi:plasmid stability protein